MLRKAKYPMLIQTDTVVVGVSNNAGFDRAAKKHKFESGAAFDVIDATGEGWLYGPESNLLSPLTAKKNWNKKEIIEFYNSSVKNEQPNKVYVGKSLSNKRVSKIVEEIVELANKP